MRKKNIISVALSVLLSFVFVAVAAYGATTISTNISTGGTLTVGGASTFSGKAKIGTDTSTNAISLVNTAGSDFGLETYTKLATDMASGWYAGSNSYMTVPITQTGNTSIFGSISELDLGTAITFSTSNAGAMWADLEILGATNLGASSAETPSYSGAVIATIVSNSTGMVVPANRHLAGVVVDSSMTSGYTDNGEVSGIVIRRSTSSKAPWPVGLRIKSGAATLGIDSSAKVRIGTAAGATGITIDGTDPDYGLQTHTLISSDVASNAYSSNYTTMTVTGAQTNNTSIFGSWSELYLGSTDVTLTLGGRNYGATWGNLEISGTTNIGESNAVTPLYSGALVGTVIGSATMVVPAYRDFAGVIADSNLTTGYTNSGSTTAAFMIRKSSGKAVWPVGLMIKGGSVTTDIQLQSGDTIKNTAASSTAISGAVTVTATSTIGLGLTLDKPVACVNLYATSTATRGSLVFVTTGATSTYAGTVYWSYGACN